ncbi:MAG TPA: CDP-alcohol phosphatidyltransferase family protein [Acidimicrobiia bacterium]|nr:CDP-alcohol phosphatidyltransferase family protein [Acidimicrobiia bacterium]
MIRLACVPLFVWLLFGRDTRLGAAALLAVLGGTDWVDGWVARRFDQASELGKVLDPTADRLLLVVAAIALAVDGSIPGLVFWPVVVREVLISAVVLVMAAMGAARIDVLWVGKAGAFGLMFALPLFLLAEAGTANDDLWRALAWICAVPGMIFSYYAAVQYAQRVPAALRAPGEDKGVTTR